VYFIYQIFREWLFWYKVKFFKFNI
jgi:hypothetical protein